MKIREGLKLREVAGEYMLLPEDRGSVDFNAVFSLSESAAWLWNTLKGRDFSEEEAVALVLGEYDVDEAVARADVSSLMNKLRDNGILDE